LIHFSSEQEHEYEQIQIEIQYIAICICHLVHYSKNMFVRVLALLLLPFVLFAQQETETPSFSQEVSVSIVNLYASVRDEKGRPVYALKQEDFNLAVDGQKQVITNFSADITEPLNLAFLLDVSGSMGILKKLEIAKGLIRGICQRLQKDDEVALLIFADGQVELLVDFTKDKQAIINRMEQLKPFGGTALRNAVAYCSRLLIQSIGKKGIVLLSDGVDTRSDLNLDEATGMASKVEIPIYAFELIRSKWIEEGLGEKAIDVAPLRSIAESTGGLYFTVDPNVGEELSLATAKIFEDLKYQYYIGYVPHGSRSGYGKVDLKTKNPNHRVRVRYSVVHGG
jgi:VWFA-related protein